MTTTTPVEGTRSPALQRLLDDLEAERCRPVPPPPARTNDELERRGRMRALLDDAAEEPTCTPG
jgi:hypothetical protein